MRMSQGDITTLVRPLCPLPGPTFQSQFYLGEMPWLRGFAPDISYSYFAAQASASRIFDGFSWKGSTSLGAAFYGYRNRLDLGNYPVYDDSGKLTGTFNSADEADNFGVSLALRSMIGMGVGATAKRISATRAGAQGSATAYDFGLMVVVPVARAFERLHRAGAYLASIPSAATRPGIRRRPGRIAGVRPSHPPVNRLHILCLQSGGTGGPAAWQWTGAPSPSASPSEK